VAQARRGVGTPATDESDRNNDEDWMDEMIEDIAKE
jgi:hypothetical protein